MASIDGDWFHSRSSSNWEELVTVREFVLESRKSEFRGFNWSKGRHGDEKIYQFAEAAGIKPSTMQTKIRAMIRYGFLRDTPVCPLEWTRIGNLWNELYEIGNHEAASKIYQLVLTIAVAIYAFNNTSNQFSLNPANGEMPLKFLFTQLNKKAGIALDEFEKLVDGKTTREKSKNTSYWKRDLINSGLFQQSGEYLVYTGEFRPLIEEIKNFKPSSNLTDDDWGDIRDNPLIDISPFKDSIRRILENLVYEQEIEEQISDSILTSPLVSQVAEQTESNLPESDILSTNTSFSNSIRRVRNATWALRIKKKYGFSCAVPSCDVIGNLFVEAAHIKPDNVPEDSKIPHRTHVLNGLCLCKHCHAAFDKGYFSMSDDYSILTSDKVAEIPEQYHKKVIISSENYKIKDRNDGREPLKDFIRYHRKLKLKV